MSRNDRNLLILGTLAILAVIVGFYLLLLGPLLERLDERAQEREAKEAQLAQLQQEVAELEEVRRNAPEIERQLLEYSKRIPEQPEIDTLIVQIEEIAKRPPGVTQLSFVPGAPEPVPGEGGFQRVPFTMGFEGTFDELQLFLGRVENLARLVTVNELVFEEAPAEEATVVEEIERVLRVEIRAETYFQPEDVPAGEAPRAPVAQEATTGAVEVPSTEGE